MNQVPTNTCPHCGRNLSTDDLRGQNCPSCGTALPHHARAAQQVALVNQMMAQHMGGTAPPPYGAYGNPHANPHVHPHYVHGLHQANQAMNTAARSIGLVIAIIAVAAVVVIGGGIGLIVLLLP